jgi:hypothetical protein
MFPLALGGRPHKNIQEKMMMTMCLKYGTGASYVIL